MRISRLLIWRVITVAWAGYIYWMSTRTFSGMHSASFIARIFDFFNFTVPPATLSAINAIVRKSAHVTEYAILGYLVYRSLGGGDRFRSQPHLAMWCVLASSLYAMTDELHQAFVPGRHASLLDCGIDAIGAASVLLVVYGSSAIAKLRSAKASASRV